MAHIAIIEKEGENLIATYQINLGSLDCPPSDEEYFSEAWRCAIEDDLVADEDRPKYRFEFTAPAP